ncbi:MAG: PIG-L family deacetylase [Chloroflexota bacterium]|nr:MAG: PIG-L family deacetylase [Chloroflexota bacterium]
MESILVVCAHPDDEVLGCGSTIARLAREQEVHVVILGEGISSRYDGRQSAPSAGLLRLREEASAVSRLLAAASVRFGDLPDNRFDELPLLDVVKRVERWVEEVQPHAVYTHHPGDLNMDHAVTFRAVLTATRPLVGCPVREVYAFEVPSSTEWAFQHLEPPFRPNVFVDVTTTIETKIQAMQTYTSEARPFPHPRSPEALRAIAQRWGSVVGVSYAEAFELIRSVIR